MRKRVAAIVVVVVDAIVLVVVVVIVVASVVVVADDAAARKLAEIRAYGEVTSARNERIIPGRARSPTRRSPTKVKWHSALRAEDARHSEERGDEEDAASRR